MLEELGAHRITKRVDCDIHYWEDFENWLADVCSVLLKEKRMLNYSI
jgi:sulfite reductase (NADPH) flavoprotein alpha-component